MRPTRSQPVQRGGVGGGGVCAAPRRSRRFRGAAGRAGARGYTLVELLVTVAVMGIAGAMVIPSMTRVNVLRIHAAVRSVVADAAFAQSDALAFQSRRVIVFGRVVRVNPSTGVWEVEEGNGYTLYAPPFGAGTLDLTADVMADPDNPGEPYTRDFARPGFGGAIIGDVNFSGADRIIFDEMGGLAADLSGDAPGLGGALRIANATTEFIIGVEAYTGRITATRVGG